MADDNSPTGSSGYNAASDPFKDLFGGNPTMGANPTQGPVTSNSAPSSGSSGTSASSDGGGVGSSSASSGTDSTDTGASTSSSQSSSTTSSSSPPSNSGISSSAAAGASDTADPMGRDGGGSYADDMSITGGGAPDGRTSYSDPASGGLSDQGPIGGISGIDGSQQAPVSLSSQATSVPSGVDDFSALRSALGIGGQPFPGATGTNFGTAMSDPTAATPAASWAGLDAPPADSIVNMGSPYNNPFRSPVGTLSDNLPPSITAPKTQDRVPQAPSFPATTAQPEAQNSAPPMQGPSNDIPQPEDPLAALRNAFGVKTATQVYPSRGNYQGYPAAAQSILRATQTGPQSSEMTQNVAPDPNFSVIPASAPPFRQGQNPDLPPGYEERYFPNGIEIPGTVENVPPEATPQRKTNNIQVTTAAPPMDPGVTDVSELPQPGDPYETASTENAPVPGTSENPIQTNQIEAPSQNDPPPTTKGSVLKTVVDLLTRGTQGDKAERDYNDYADMSPEQKQAWQERRDAEQRVADSRDGGGARGEAEQNRRTTTDEQIDELNLQIAELQAELARRRAASQRSAAQYGLIMRNYA